VIPLPAGGAKTALVREMFERIAPRYDRMNRLVSLGLDQRWRRASIAAIGVGPGDRVVDLACGTGDLAELAARAGARVVALDSARGMLRGARARGVGASLGLTDAASLPLRSGCASAVTCGFALRNFSAPEAVLGEAARVLHMVGHVADRPLLVDARIRRAHRIRRSGEAEVVPADTRDDAADCGIDGVADDDVLAARQRHAHRFPHYGHQSTNDCHGLERQLKRAHFPLCHYY
jgi:SAM-dependent methyltransferase